MGVEITSVSWLGQLAVGVSVKSILIEIRMFDLGQDDRILLLLSHIKLSTEFGEYNVFFI